MGDLMQSQRQVHTEVSSVLKTHKKILWTAAGCLLVFGFAQIVVLLKLYELKQYVENYENVIEQTQTLQKDIGNLETTRASLKVEVSKLSNELDKNKHENEQVLAAYNANKENLDKAREALDEYAKLSKQIPILREEERELSEKKELYTQSLQTMHQDETNLFASISKLTTQESKLKAQVEGQKLALNSLEQELDSLFKSYLDHFESLNKTISEQKNTLNQSVTSLADTLNSNAESFTERVNVLHDKINAQTDSFVNKLNASTTSLNTNLKNINDLSQSLEQNVTSFIKQDFSEVKNSLGSLNTQTQESLTQLQNNQNSLLDSTKALSEHNSNLNQVVSELGTLKGQLQADKQDLKLELEQISQETNTALKNTNTSLDQAQIQLTNFKRQIAENVTAVTNSLETLNKAYQGNLTSLENSSQSLDASQKIFAESNFGQNLAEIQKQVTDLNESLTQIADNLFSLKQEIESIKGASQETNPVSETQEN